MYYEWKEKIFEQYVKSISDDMNQFGIYPINDNSEIGKELICNNIFGTNDNEAILKIFNSNQETAIIVGYGGNSYLHMGHLLLANEILFYLRKIPKCKIYFVNFDVDTEHTFVEKICNIVSNNIDYEIVDYHNIEAMKLKKKISKITNVNTINRVMGWKNECIESYEKTIDMITTFSLSNILSEQQSIIISDINQKTFYTLFKSIQDKLELNGINCFLYHMLIPSLKAPNQRMSIKDSKSILFMDDNIEIIESKLRKSFTGVEDKQYTCSMLRVLDLLVQNAETEKIIEDCIHNNNYCSLCKNKNIENIKNQILCRRKK